MVAAGVCAEGLDSEISTTKHDIEVEPPKPVSKSRNTEASARVCTSGYIVISIGLGYLLPGPFTYAHYFVIAMVFDVIYLSIT